MINDIIDKNIKKIKISEMEYLYTYLNDKNDKIAVFEYQGKKIEKKISES